MSMNLLNNLIKESIKLIRNQYLSLWYKETQLSCVFKKNIYALIFTTYYKPYKYILSNPKEFHTAIIKFEQSWRDSSKRLAYPLLVFCNKHPLPVML